ncbi:hypothetical protein CPC08DRAFT_63388 [Agrocybe pediades]|nr:hypothetical protein CPC08DRAFT_63388 [Agrocybe pediades]
MASSSRNIPPNPTRWKPNPNPASIVVPGVDTEASTADQIEQIEQLITIKLQNIDENFSKIHNVLATKLLPAIKRYAVGTEPVREAAKFWTSFYEQAAQIRIPTIDDDYSTVNETPSAQEEEQEETSQYADQQEQASVGSQDTTTRPEIYEASVVNSETSFFPQGGFASTPATARHAATANSFASQVSEDPSWTASMESPLVRLNREIDNFSKESEDSILSSTPDTHRPEASRVDDLTELTFQQDRSKVPLSAKGKAKEVTPLLKNVLRHNLYSASDNSSFDSTIISKLSPAKPKKPKTPTIDKSLNPYLRPNDTPTEWSGIVDLRDPSAFTPQRYRSDKAMANYPTTPYQDEDDSFEGLPPGMSPPVLVSPARPPRTSAELGLLRLGQTPAKDASARIQRDLIRDFQQQSSGDTRRLFNFAKDKSDSTMSTVTTPPSLSRYRPGNEYNSTENSLSKDTSLEDMIRRIRVDIRPNVGMTPGMGSTPGLNIRPKARVRDPIVTPPVAGHGYPPQTPEGDLRSQPLFDTPGAGTPGYDLEVQEEIREDFDSDDSMDSLDEINNTAHPSAAFLMASERAGQFDDSFGSSNQSGDSLAGDEVIEGLAPVHPFAGVVNDDGFDDDDDSFDDFNRGDYQTETVFGVPPMQAGTRLSDGRNLHLHGSDLLNDTESISTHISAAERVEQSPTPANWAH